MIERKLDHIAAIGGSIAAIVARFNGAEVMEFILFTVAGGFIGGFGKAAAQWIFELLKTWWQKKQS